MSLTPAACSLEKPADLVLGEPLLIHLASWMCLLYLSSERQESSNWKGRWPLWEPGS